MPRALTEQELLDRVAKAALKIFEAGELLLRDAETPQEAVARIAGVHAGHVRQALKQLGFQNVYASSGLLFCTRVTREHLEARVHAPIIASDRLRTASPVAEIDALAQIADEPDLEVVARAVRDSIDKNEPVVGLDRLHTLATAFLRALCAKRGVAMDKSKPLNSIFGDYVRQLREMGHLESKMTTTILKSMFAPLEAFNQVRNDQSLAHDNTLLNHTKPC